MASLIHSIRNFTEDEHIGLKFIFLFSPMLLLYFIGSTVTQEHKALYYMIILYYFGYMIVAMNKALGTSEVNLPNPLTTLYDVFYRGIIGLVAIIPMIAASFALILWLEGLNTEIVLKYIFIIVALISCFSLIMFQLTLYSRNYSFVDAFNFKILYEAGGEFIIQIFKLIVQIFLIILLPAYFINLGMYQAFGRETEVYAVFQIIFYAFIVMSLYLAIPQHFVQIYEELVITKEDKDYLKL